MAEKSPELRLRAHVFALADELELSRGDRIACAVFVLNREVTSYAHLTPPELERMVDAFRGALCYRTSPMVLSDYQPLKGVHLAD